MGKYHVTVYAICKNEAQFVQRWMDSMGEADEVVVLDTGSTDDTPELLRALGAKVTVERVEPWRFDVARNRSLELVDEKTDICVCTDLDEFFLPGWRDALEAVWGPGVDQVCYHYIWNFQSDGSDGVSFWADKIHARRGFYWTHPVHEVIQRAGEGGKVAYADAIRLEHHADAAKSRGQYLPLLELSVREDPEDDRNMHYLGREYYFHRRWREAADTLQRHLQLKSAVWPEERCASMRYLAQCYLELGEEDEAERWLLRACGECPWLREPWLETAKFYHSRENWQGVIFAARRALDIQQRPQHYLTQPESWGSLPYDLLAVALYYTGDYRHALAMGEEALKRSPMDERLRENVRLIRQRTTIL